jgi:cation transport regulator ChaC
LEAVPGWEWDLNEADYQKRLGALKQFVEREGHASPLSVYVEDFQGEKINLGTWVASRRKDFKAEKLSAERIAALEALPGWEWDPNEADYKKHLGALKQFVEREGHASPPQNHVEDFQGEKLNLGTWAGSRRTDFKVGRLSAERTAALEALPGWEWDPFEAAYQKYLEALKQFVEREGHASPPQNHVEDFQGEKLNLGTWVSNRRTDFKAEKLSAERTAELKAVPGWVWSTK